MKETYIPGDLVRRKDKPTMVWKIHNSSLSNELYRVNALEDDSIELLLWHYRIIPIPLTPAILWRIMGGRKSLALETKIDMLNIIFCIFRSTKMTILSVFGLKDLLCYRMLSMFISSNTYYLA